MAELIIKKELLTRIRLNYNNHQNVSAGAIKDMIDTTPTTTEAEIRAKAIDEFAEKFKTHCDKMKHDEWNRHARPLSWENAYEQFKDEIDYIAEQLKGE